MTTDRRRPRGRRTDTARRGPALAVGGPPSSGRSGYRPFTRIVGNGFTLIELLVVIAVIAILAAILFPVFAQAREKARQTTCLSNMKQLGVAANLYVEDWDEGFPQTHPTGTPWSHRSRRDRLVADWFQLLAPYTRTPAVNVCPSDPNISARRPNSYIPNGYFVYGARLGDVPRPAETIYLYESADDNGDFETRPWLGWEELQDEDVAVRRHHRGANYLFCDWHVRWLSFEQTLAPVNMHQP